MSAKQNSASPNNHSHKQQAQIAQQTNSSDTNGNNDNVMSADDLGSIVDGAYVDDTYINDTYINDTYADVYDLKVEGSFEGVEDVDDSIQHSADGYNLAEIEGYDTDGDMQALAQKLAQASEQLISIRDFIRFCVTQLRDYDVVIAQGTTDVFAEAAAIVLHTLSLDWSADAEILDCRLTHSEKQAVLSLLQERIATRKPLSYLVNLAYFCGLPFYVDERVLIPRSPIAELIRQQFYPYFAPTSQAEPLLSAMNGKTRHGELAFFEHGLAAKHLKSSERILDLCTGSGCIAIALATRFADASVDASDIDKSALEVAAVNVEHHGLEHQVNLIASNLFEKIPADNQYDLIVTNPPYVDAEAMAELPPEFLHEPEHALAAGQDGLDLVHHILHDAPDYLSNDGLLVCEVGDSEWHLRQAYPHIDFNWLTFINGGHGIFAITCEALKTHRQDFATHIQTYLQL